MTSTDAAPSTSAIPPTMPPGLRYRRRLRWVDARRELVDARGLIRTLVERDLRIRYKQTVLGFGWALVTPVVFMLVFTLFFQRAGHFATGGVPYPLFSYLGLVPWTFFAEATTVGSLSLINNLTLLNKVYCPREVFPIGTTIAAAFDTVVAAVVLVVLFVVEGRVPAATSVWVPLLVLIELAFTLGVSLLSSAVLVYLRDVRYVVPLLVQIGMFATPVAYGISTIPASIRPAYSVLDPLGPVIASFRLTILFDRPPDGGLLVLAAVASLAWLVGGYLAFKRLETGIADIA